MRIRRNASERKVQSRSLHYPLQRTCCVLCVTKGATVCSASGAQILWVQAEDYLDDVHFADMSTEEKLAKKSAWLRSNYHAMRTGGVPSLLPLVYDLPLRMLGANYGAQHSGLKEQGVHNQGRGLLKGWELHESDMAQVRASESKSIILQKIPKRIAVLVCRKEEEDQLEDRVENYV